MGKVLVTGATGFLGGALMRHLRQEGYQVIGIGRAPEPLARLRADGFDVLSWDLAAPLPDGIGLLDGLEAVVHCAALSSPFGRLAAFRAANVTATACVLDLARRQGVRRFIQISSASVSFAPGDRLAIREDSPLPPPFNAYARTKAEAEVMVLAAPELGPIVLRPRGIYGAGDSALVPRLLRAVERGPLPLLRGGAGRIDLTHVDDVIAAILAALAAGPGAEGQVFNISGGEVLPITRIVAKVCARMHMTPRWRAMPLGPLMLVAGAMEAVASRLPNAREPVVTRYALALFAYAQGLDIAKAGQLLSWQPQVSFDEGLARTFTQGVP